MKSKITKDCAFARWLSTGPLPMYMDHTATCKKCRKKLNYHRVRYIYNIKLSTYKKILKCQKATTTDKQH